MNNFQILSQIPAELINDVVCFYEHQNVLLRKRSFFKTFLIREELVKYLSDVNFNKWLLFQDGILLGLAIWTHDPALTAYYDPVYFRSKGKNYIFIPRGGFVLDVSAPNIVNFAKTFFEQNFAGISLVVDYTPDITESYEIFKNGQILDEMIGMVFKKCECDVSLSEYPMAINVSEETRLEFDCIATKLGFIFKEGFKKVFSPCPQYFSLDDLAYICGNKDFRKFYLMQAKDILGVAILSDVRKVPFMNESCEELEKYQTKNLVFIWDFVVDPKYRSISLTKYFIRSVINALPHDSYIFFDYSSLGNKLVPKGLMRALKLQDKKFGLKIFQKEVYKLIDK